MTKSVICRIIQSRPLVALQVLPQEDPGEPSAAFRRPNNRREWLPRRYPHAGMSPKAHRGIWIDYLA